MLGLSPRSCKSYISYSLHNCWSCYNILIKLILVYSCCVLFFLCYSFIVPASLRTSSFNLGILLLLFIYPQDRAVCLTHIKTNMQSFGGLRQTQSWCPPHPCTRLTIVLFSSQHKVFNVGSSKQVQLKVVVSCVTKRKKRHHKNNKVNYEKHFSSIILLKVPFLYLFSPFSLFSSSPLSSCPFSPSCSSTFFSFLLCHQAIIVHDS